ncbi:MAG TPA: ATP-binding cassette domain-containing protein [Polyangiaceae bacterium]
MSDAVIDVRGVSKRYAGHVAVDALSVQVRKGSVFGLLGPNGAGKTTTIRMMNDIVKPDDGQIVLFGALAPGRAASRRIGYLPEERGLYPKMTVRRVLTFLAELRGLTRREAKGRIVRWIDRLELGAWTDRKVESLSKGMQQKVQFIATVLHQPDLLILDEPFSGLDPINADLLRSIVLEEKARGTTILYSTHSMEHAEQMCDDICILARSRRVLSGDLAAIKDAARAERRAVIVELRNGHGDGAPRALAPGADTGVSAVRKVRGGYEATLAPGSQPRDLLRRLLDADLDIARFEQAAPTLHEIFIQKVTAADAAELGTPMPEGGDRG